MRKEKSKDDDERKASLADPVKSRREATRSDTEGR
jgi:hypothetical protein